MHITQSRVVNIKPYLRGFKTGERIYVGLVNPSAHKGKLTKIGFTPSLAVGERVLPLSQGRISTFNAEGKHNVRKDLPMETAYTQIEWHWKEWDGTEHSKIVDRPYKRYPREFVPPPSKELQILKNGKGDTVVASDPFKLDTKNLEDITHTVNLLLEIFGDCDVLKQDLIPIVPTAIKRLNWKVLPQGKYPWSKLSGLVAPILARAKKGKRPVISERLETIGNKVPEFVAVGDGGYRGYLIFGFPKKGLFILESAYYGNATYVFDKKWEELSKMTKAEILSASLQKERIVHLKKTWPRAINRLLS